jgi:hypothetical protein
VERPMTARVALGADISLPGVMFSRQQLLVVTDAAPYANYPARGIIGKTLFNCVMEIDYDAGVLHLYDSAAFTYGGSGEKLDFGFSQGIPVIDASVSIDGGKELPVKMLVDSANLPESSRDRTGFFRGALRAPFAARPDESIGFAWGSILWMVSSHRFLTRNRGEARALSDRTA